MFHVKITACFGALTGVSINAVDGEKKSINEVVKGFVIPDDLKGTSWVRLDPSNEGDKKFIDDEFEGGLSADFVYFSHTRLARAFGINTKTGEIKDGCVNETMMRPRDTKYGRLSSGELHFYNFMIEVQELKENKGVENQG